MSATFFIAMLIGILALLTLCRRIGWLRTCSLMVLWGVAADSHANSLVYAWWIVFGWMLHEDLFYYGGPAWQTQSADWLPIMVLSLSAVALLIVALHERRKHT